MSRHVALRAIGLALHVALRAIGVALPAVAVIGVVELRGGVPDGDFGTFLGAMALSLLAAAVWSAMDARRAQTSRVVTLWVATAFAYYALSGSMFFTVPLLVAAGLGVAAGAAARKSEAKARHATGAGH